MQLYENESSGVVFMEPFKYLNGISFFILMGRVNDHYLRKTDAVKELNYTVLSENTARKNLLD